MTLKLVIFDCDGVLVDTEPTTERIMAASFTHYGLNISPHEVGALFTGGTMKSAGDAARAMGADLPADWVGQINAEVGAELAKGVGVFDGLFDLLDACDAAGIAQAIASNGPMSKMRVSLTPSGLWDRFKGRIYSGHDYAPKPAPEMIHHAMKAAQSTQADTVFIDDSIPGCRAGIAAGVKTFGFMPTGDTSELRKVGATPVRSMADVKAILFARPTL